MKPQTASILRLLIRHPEGVTQLQALEEARCLRLAARVADLRADGFDIRSELVSGNGKRWAKYTLIVKGEQVSMW